MTIAKVADFVKLVQRLEKAHTMCLQREAQEERCFEKSRKRQLAEMKEELHFANKQLIMVRRAALRHLLSFEHLQYQLELNHLGKSFYVERL
ncbi:cilia- and flagella-associated protein 141 isoform X2 [Hemicordylus capensis]|uniref:cilia- and flagella-associated protein 141 isoform X2 n=1 Tax=Hemicordylus capensis TaxID=884348 RepID=UPI002303CBE4|nr:cilia- and flagella-associated protein 141 isoform X2 [Hemicordylus capensis]